ncbi:four-carbon acid sugar kinase family protein [Arthrobacter zhaoguopingii]|uniref:four-carbon acid sugar kinase family protein n=1 Tax=Arthrobacter zhaoguopingii TaxID=2681491 RepID=UPI0013578B69|nr:four-carbon acid sugar kinase family protein [Arthrobacter zhaoguopingii]
MSPIGIAPAVIGIAADDLTGANDSVVQFARAGWSSRLALGELPPEPAEPSSALAVVTDARALGDDAARRATADAVGHLVGAGADHLYLKIDSTMRGSAAAQIDGALAEWKQRHPGAFAVVCPAYPAMGRTVENGLLRVNGEPVENTPIGRDPVTPVRTGAMQQLIPGSTGIRLQGNSTADHIEQLMGAAEAGSGMVTVDAVTDSGLELLAAAISELGPRAFPVGSAGLAGAMAAVWAGRAGLPAAASTPDGASESASPSTREGVGVENGDVERTGESVAGTVPDPAAGRDGGASRNGRILIVVSSLNDTSRAQVNRLIAELPPEELLVLRPGLAVVTDRPALSAWIGRQLAPSGELPGVVMVLSPIDRASDTGVRGVEIAAGLAVLAGNVLSCGDVAALALIGGDGARAVLSACEARSILISGAIEEGVPVGVVEGGQAAGKTVVTKAGGFGQPDSLVSIVRKLLESTPLSKEALP